MDSEATGHSQREWDGSFHACTRSRMDGVRNGEAICRGTPEIGSTLATANRK